jgi:hypothetical protein
MFPIGLQKILHFIAHLDTTYYASASHYGQENECSLASIYFTVHAHAFAGALQAHVYHLFSISFIQNFNLHILSLVNSYILYQWA